MNIGLYFGSFNPVHIGHLIVASHVAQNTSLDQVWFVVTPQNPFKPAASLLNEYHRLHLVRLAVEDHPFLKCSDVEFKLLRPSFTIDTLTYISEKHSQHTFSVILGSDSYLNFHKWKNAELIRKHYSLYVYERPGFLIERKDVSTHFVDAPLLNISASMIRNSLKKGQSVRYFVPDKVLFEIERSNYYK